MQVAALTEWLNSPETRALVALLRVQRGAVMQTFLQGQPVDPVRQGRAAALHDLMAALAMPADEVKRIFETALKEQRT